MPVDSTSVLIVISRMAVPSFKDSHPRNDMLLVKLCN